MRSASDTLINNKFNPQAIISKIATPHCQEAFSSNIDGGTIRKKQRSELSEVVFDINLEKIVNGSDLRTTLMIRHIPNKYTVTSLLEEINIFNKNKFDFFYLPLDNDVV